MRVETEIKKWGKGLALPVDGIMAEVAHLEAGTKVTVDVSSEKIVVKPAFEKLGELRALRFLYRESEMLTGITPHNAHADMLADPRGPEVGNCVWRRGYAPYTIV